jgi:hypothetical protein
MHFPANNPSKAMILSFDAPTNGISGDECAGSCSCSVILDEATVLALQASPAR